MYVMSAQEASTGGGGAPHAPAPPGSLSELREDVHPLGQALKARAADVLLFARPLDVAATEAFMQNAAWASNGRPVLP
jgi:hypothetical protein